MRYIDTKTGEAFQLNLKLMGMAAGPGTTHLTLNTFTDLALSPDSLTQVLAVAARTGNDRLMVGFNRRFAPLLTAMKNRFGAVTAGSARYLVNAARTFIFSTALPPPAVAGAVAALELLEDRPRRVDKLAANAAMKNRPVLARSPLSSITSRKASYSGCASSSAKAMCRAMN